MLQQGLGAVSNVILVDDDWCVPFQHVLKHIRDHFGPISGGVTCPLWHHGKLKVAEGRRESGLISRALLHFNREECVRDVIRRKPVCPITLADDVRDVG